MRFRSPGTREDLKGGPGTNGNDGAACLPSNPAWVIPKRDPGTNGTNGNDAATLPCFGRFLRLPPLVTHDSTT